MAFLKNLLKKGGAERSRMPIKGATPNRAISSAVPLKILPAAVVVNENAGIGILEAPHITEKSVAGNARGVYTFRIRGGANKMLVRRAVEERYGVHVRGVRIVKAKSKIRRPGRRTGILPGFTKALVSLAVGEKIELGA